MNTWWSAITGSSQIASRRGAGAARVEAVLRGVRRHLRELRAQVLARVGAHVGHRRLAVRRAPGREAAHVRIAEVAGGALAHAQDRSAQVVL